MTIGIPKGLLYSKYHVFAETFFTELGAEIVVSPDTNRAILDAGTRSCVDEACLPVKVFHGHVASLRGKCEAMLIPRFMRMEKGKSICPMFCGLIEMLSADIVDLPPLIDLPIFGLDDQSVWAWAKRAGGMITRNRMRIRRAFYAAMEKQRAFCNHINDSGYAKKIALIGHAYNVHDRFMNMNLIEKLRRLGIGVATHELVDRQSIKDEAKRLFKPPFWFFAREYYGAAVHLAKANKVDGLIYISAFSCGVDSVVIELIKTDSGDFPLLVLKIDEHTGEAGFNTRIEAFADMLIRRPLIDNYNSAYGEYLSGSKSAV